VTATIQENVDQLWANQETLSDIAISLEWKLSTILHALSPEEYEEPPSLEELLGAKEESTVPAPSSNDD
jgi:hypothetical protein